MKLQLFGRRIFEYYNHYVYSLNYNDYKPISLGRLIAFEVSPSSYDFVKANKDIKMMLENQSDFVKGWGFRNQNGSVVGHVYLMSKGGNEVLYKIRNIDSYIFSLRVYEQWRGNNYAGEIMSWVAEYQHQQGINESWFVVKKNNVSAIKVYERIGCRVVGSRRFVRILGHNLPYHVL